MKIKESLNVTFDETPPPSKTSPLVDDDLDEEEIIKVYRNKLDENGVVSRNKASVPDQMAFRGTDNQEKDEKQRQNDKTGLGMEKTVKDKAKSKPESQSSQKVNRKVNWSKPKSTPGPKSKKYKFRG
ncbi:hypothetical protein Tco_1012598 [Tanacetum coccineum]